MTPTIAYSAVLEEFQHRWLPHITDTGLDRLTELLATQSPLLIHGAFTRVLPMGCLASHIAWHHPQTAHKQEDAGICWLTRVAKLNPATSRLIVRWDEYGYSDRKLVADLLAICQAERNIRLTRLCERLTFTEPETCSC